MREDPFELAVVTGELAPDLSDGGKRLAATLADRGFRCDPVMWDNPTVSWGEYDGVLLRSCWEYPDDRRRFRAMLDELDHAGVPVCNSLPVVRWNLHKSYLTTLAEKGVHVPSTTLVEQGDSRSLESVLSTMECDDAVVKPAIGAMSSQVWRTSRADVADSESRFAELVADNDVLVQAFVPEITTGERSLVFFGGSYSHAWNSLTATDDITAFDGIDADYTPSPEIRAQAAQVLQAACEVLDIDGAQLPYARIDYVERGADLVLMELELIEPYLGFDRGDHTIERFARAITSYFEGVDAEP